MINFSCIQDLIDIANAQERTIDDIVVEYEATHSFKSVIYIKENMQTIWQVMKESAEKSINNTQTPTEPFGPVFSLNTAYELYKKNQYGKYLKDVMDGKFIDQ